MAVPRKAPPSRYDANADQLTLADWERDQTRDAQQTTTPAPLAVGPGKRQTTIAPCRPPAAVQSEASGLVDLRSRTVQQPPPRTDGSNRAARVRGSPHERSPRVHEPARDETGHAPGPHLSLPDVVDRYSGVWSRWTIYDHVRAGLLPHLKLPGRRELLFPLATSSDTKPESAISRRSSCRTAGGGAGHASAEGQPAISSR